MFNIYIDHINESNSTHLEFSPSNKNKTQKLNRETMPFGQQYSQITPGVGYYFNEKKIPKRIQNEITKANKRKEMEEGIDSKAGFYSSSKRPCLDESQKNSLGPGQYQVDTNMVKKVSDTKDVRFPKKNKSTIFISTSPRFKDIKGASGRLTSQAQSNKKKFNEKNSENQTQAEKNFDKLKQIKQNNFDQKLQRERSKQSFMFQSKANRFSSPKPIRVENISAADYHEMSKNAALYGAHQSNMFMSDADKSTNSLLMTSYAAAIDRKVPFNSNAPRFRNTVQSAQDTASPGDFEMNTFREVDDMDMRSPVKIPSAVFKGESRLKHSMIDSIIKDKSYIKGPGAYNTNKSSLVKKTFNYDLARGIH